MIIFFIPIKKGTYYDQTKKESKINLYREDLANIIGTARESLGRLLKDFREEGSIEINKRTIMIKDPKKLERIANSR